MVTWASLVAVRTVTVQVVEVPQDHVRVPHDAQLTPQNSSPSRVVLPFSDALTAVPSLQQHCCPCDRCVLMAPLLVVVATTPPQRHGPSSPSSPVQRSTVPLRCPMRRATPVVPARFSSCTHLSCFDCFAVLHQWLHRFTEGFDWDDFCSGALRDVVWRCPCCHVEAPMSIHTPAIVVDGWLMDQLSSRLRSNDDITWTLEQNESGVVSAIAAEKPARRFAPRPSMVVAVGE
ncbi:zinc finger protein, putative [Bodo saltans]|uniref:Zinc finger protein, putative n=1 Tax=Bodo saltans TaxID=75058 RepID=A0A0S4JMH9_BODSA|nr:zinc finger protein, putative [Bodo saltans]|eukprot:CUG91366.1 zinc finger protein, putative [Bodo saltans]